MIVLVFFLNWWGGGVGAAPQNFNINMLKKKDRDVVKAQYGEGLARWLYLQVHTKVPVDISSFYFSSPFIGLVTSDVAI